MRSFLGVTRAASQTQTLRAFCGNQLRSPILDHGAASTDEPPLQSLRSGRLRCLSLKTSDGWTLCFATLQTNRRSILQDFRHFDGLSSSVLEGHDLPHYHRVSSSSLSPFSASSQLAPQCPQPSSLASSCRQAAPPCPPGSDP